MAGEISRVSLSRSSQGAGPQLRTSVRRENEPKIRSRLLLKDEVAGSSRPQCSSQTTKTTGIGYWLPLHLSSVRVTLLMKSCFEPFWHHIPKNCDIR